MNPATKDEELKIKKWGVPHITCAWRDKNFPLSERVKVYREAYRVRRTLPRSAKHLANGDWIRFVLSVNRVNQAEAFAEVAHRLPDRAYWRLLGHIFWSARNHDIYRDLYLELMRAPRPHHHCFHTVEQQQGWDKLPDKVMIFRGHGPNNKYGIWYTLQVMVACGLAYDHGEGKVASYIVPKRDLFYGGGHQEAVFFVQGLKDVQDSLRQVARVQP